MLIVAVEGPPLAGKSTLVESLQNLLSTEGYNVSSLKEYVCYIDDRDERPERPLHLIEDAVREGDFYIMLEERRQKDMAELIANVRSRDNAVIILDRAFYTCLVYSRISKNPVAEQMYRLYWQSTAVRHPDLLFFLRVDPNSAEYHTRLKGRRDLNPYCIGLSCKIDEYSYIYRPHEYYTEFTREIAAMKEEVVILEFDKVDAGRCFPIIRERIRMRR